MATANAVADFTIDQPTADRWMYPFNSTPGTRPAASAFGAVGEAGFDDRDGQILVRFNTTSLFAAGLGASSYNIGSLSLSLTVNLDNAFQYDPTYDSYRTHLDPNAPGYQADSDAGTPVELFAVGYRNGYSESTFQETSPFGPNGEGTRNAYAAGLNPGGTMVDVSNNVANGFEAVPFAIGTIAGLAPGSFVPADSVMTFNLDLSNPAVVAWLQSSLNDGYLEFMVTSLQSTSQQATSGFPSFYMKENILNDPTSSDPTDHIAAKLSGNISTVPEPGTIGLLLVAACAVAGLRGIRHA